MNFLNLIFFFFLIGFSECFFPFFENTFLFFKDNSDVMLNEKTFNNEVIKRKDSFFEYLKNDDEEEIRKKKCCLLGKRAGFKGFHCNLDFYSKSLINRVRNRTHRKHIKVLGNDKEHLINKQLIFKFSNCLNGQEMVFENCCWNEVESILKI